MTARLRRTRVKPVRQRWYSLAEEDANVQHNELETTSSLTSPIHDAQDVHAAPPIPGAENPTAALPSRPHVYAAPVYANEESKTYALLSSYAHPHGPRNTKLDPSTRNSADAVSRATHPLSHPASLIGGHGPKPAPLRGSLASTGGGSVSTAEDGYTTDVTMSTLPPSYRRHRSIPDRPFLATPFPTASTHSLLLLSPPPAFVRPGHRTEADISIQPHASTHHAASSSERGNSSFTAHIDEASGLGDTRSTIPSNVERTRSHGPRKSADGGVRLAGGPLDMPAEDVENPFEDFALDSASMTSAPSYHTQS